MCPARAGCKYADVPMIAQVKCADTGMFSVIKKNKKACRAKIKGFGRIKKIKNYENSLQTTKIVLPLPNYKNSLPCTLRN
jgi:hypothetical protein